MKAIVTGATGLIGKALVRELHRLSWEVICLGRHPTAMAGPGVTSYRADLSDAASLRDGIQANADATVLFHIAALMPGHLPRPTAEAFVQANTLGSFGLFEAALQFGIERVVYASGVSVIGRPDLLPVTEAHPLRPRSEYTISKLGGELFAEYFRITRGLKATSLRISSPYGPGMRHGSVLPRFASAALRGERLTWFGTGSRSQNFVHIRDVARALVLAATEPAFGVYNVGGAESISMKSLAELLVELTPGTGASATAAGSPDPHEAERWELSHTRAVGELGYVPSVSLREGLQEYLQSLREVHGPTV